MSDFMTLMSSGPFWSLALGGLVPALLVWFFNRLNGRIKELERWRRRSEGRFPGGYGPGDRGEDLARGWFTRSRRSWPRL